MKNSTQLLFTLFLFFALSKPALAQDSTSDTSSSTAGIHNQVMYLEGMYGAAGGNGGGIGAGFQYNFSKGKNLFTARVNGTLRIHFGLISPWLPVPFPISSSSMLELGGLYGRRFITNRGEAFSFSLGLSANNFVFEGKNNETKDVWIMGVPFEANIHWFKRRVAPIKILGKEITNSTAFGGGIGFKMYGNISKASFVGAGITFGLGNYRDYGTLIRKEK